MDALRMKKAMYLHRTEGRSAKTKIDFADISTFDIVPTPPKEPKPAAKQLRRRHRIGLCKEKVNTYETKYESTQDCGTQISGTGYGNERVSSDFLGAKDPNFPWYCPSPRTEHSLKVEKRAHGQANAVQTTFEDQQKNTSVYEVISNNPIRYPAPGPREQLTPSPFPVNKNKLAPVVDPRKNVVSKPPRPGPRPVKAKHMPVYCDNTESSCMLTQMYGCREDYVPDSVIPLMRNDCPIRYPSPGPREQLLPNPFPVNKNSLPPLIKQGRVVSPMCG